MRKPRHREISLWIKGALLTGEVRRALVEAAGIEPASVSTTLQDLHA
jgi:hypothetical protein